MDLLWRRADARNVSSRISLRWSHYPINSLDNKTKYLLTQMNVSQYKALQNFMLCAFRCIRMLTAPPKSASLTVLWHYENQRSFAWRKIHRQCTSGCLYQKKEPPRKRYNNIHHKVIVVILGIVCANAELRSRVAELQNTSRRLVYLRYFPSSRFGCPA